MTWVATAQGLGRPPSKLTRLLPALDVSPSSTCSSARLSLGCPAGGNEVRLLKRAGSTGCRDLVRMDAVVASVRPCDARRTASGLPEVAAISTASSPHSAGRDKHSEDLLSLSPPRMLAPPSMLLALDARTRRGEPGGVVDFAGVVEASARAARAACLGSASNSALTFPLSLSFAVVTCSRRST